MNCGVSDLQKRHEHAKARADNRDSKWFKSRPFAFMRVREALPFEQLLNNASGHGPNPYVLVCLSEDRRTFDRIHFFANGMPDGDHASLVMLQGALTALAEREPDETGRIAASPDDLEAVRGLIASVRAKAPRSHRLAMRAADMASSKGGFGG